MAVAALAQPMPAGHAAHHPTAAPAAAVADPDTATTPADHAAHHAGAMPPAASGGMGDMMSGMMGGSPAAAPAAPVPGGPSPSPVTAGTMPPPAASGATPGGMAGMGGGGCCGGGGAKPFYPALMDMPSLTPEARQFIETEAAARLGLGSEAITSGQAPLHQALANDDPLAAQVASSSVREGVKLVESGASALQAVHEDQSPRRIALTWFTGEMGVSRVDEAGGAATGDGPWGLTWSHVTVMAMLVAFLIGAIVIHFARARRISGLVERLTPGGASAAAKPAPTAGKPASPPAKPAAPAAAPPAAAPASGPAKPWTGNLRVAGIFTETPNVKTFRLRCQDGEKVPFTFLPGQFVTFSAQIDGKPIRRSYTIASSPAQRDYIELTVKREDQGAESRYLHDHVAVGDLLAVVGPSGVFTFTGAEADSIVLVSGGVGITPMMCVTRYLTDCGYKGDIFFLHGARTPEDFIFREELEYLRKRHPNLHVSATVADGHDGAWPGGVGPISTKFIAFAVPDIGRRRVHVCGPPGMMEAVKAELAELGVASDKIKSEAFGPAKGAAPAPEAKAGSPPEAAKPAYAKSPSPPESAAPEGAVAPAPTEPTEKGDAPPSAQAKVQFSKSGKSGQLAPDQSVLEAAEAIGVAIDFSCRVGICGVCVVPLTSGTVTMAVQEGLPPDQKAKGIILACQAKSAGDLVVDA